MPKYYIDTADGETFIRDEVGYDFPDLQAAKTAAVDALPDMAREELPDGDARTFLAIVRGEVGLPILQASLTFQVISMVPTSVTATTD